MALGRELCDAGQVSIGEAHLLQPRPCSDDPLPQAVFLSPIALERGCRVVVECQTLANGLDPLPGVAEISDLYTQSEPIEELGPQLAFFRIHGANEKKLRCLSFR